MLPDKSIRCPYTGFAKSCLDGVVKHKCPKWVRVLGRHPQTGAEMDRYDCSDALVPLLLIENALVSRQTAAAIEDFRNNVISLNRGLSAPPLPNNQPKMIDG
jgi:hypothetical protein